MPLQNALLFTDQTLSVYPLGYPMAKIERDWIESNVHAERADWSRIVQVNVEIVSTVTELRQPSR